MFIGELNKNASALGIIMAGGTGTRFWPMSRATQPKQFLPLGDDSETLIQGTVRRLEGLCSRQEVMIVASGAYRGLVEQQVPGAAMVLEPCARNTGPCLLIAALYAQELVGDVPLVCLPADHFVQGFTAVRAVYKRAIDLVMREDVLVTFGIPPTGPETGFGYIEVESVDAGLGDAGCEVRRFIEKPPREKAIQFLRDGRFFWNSGMFVWKPSTFIKAVEEYCPELAPSVPELQRLVRKKAPAEEIAEAFSSLSSISVDVGVMERAKNVRMFLGAGFRWSDVGSWSSWVECARERSVDQCNNVSRGEAVFVDCRGSAAVSSKKLIAAVGLDEVVIVETDDAILVCKKDRSQNVRQVTEALAALGRSDLL